MKIKSTFGVIVKNRTQKWKQKKDETITQKSVINKSQSIKSLEKIQIQEGASILLDEPKVYGIYDPASEL